MDIVVPSFGESVTEAHVAKVLVKDGEMVISGAEILELETDKVNQVITAPSSGTVYLSVKEGDSVFIGQSVGQISASESAALPTEEKNKSTENMGEEIRVKTENPSATLPETLSQAAETIQPSKSSAHSSRKTTDDFLYSLQKSTEMASPTSASQPKQIMSRAAPSPKPEQEINPEIRETSEPRITIDEKRKRMTPFRMTIAKKLVEVKNQTAMLTTFNEVDMKEIMAIRSKEKDSFIEKHGVKLGFTSFFLKASVQALKAFPEIHARIDGSDIVYPLGCDIGIAVSTDRGLAVPVIRGCERLSFAEMEKQLARLADRARTSKLSLADLTGGTFTITNGGVFGSLFSTPILHPLQSAILGMHAIQKRVMVRDDKMVILPMMYLALSYDHRIVDGKEAVSFLVHIKDNLEEPTRLLLDF